MLSLSQHVEVESLRWAAEHQAHYYPTSPSASASTISDLENDNDSVFSASTTRSRSSSVSSIASEDAANLAPLAFQPRDPSGNPIAVYASLDQAVAQSTASVEAQEPRRLVTPGKLYENEDDDDEILEYEDHELELQQQQQGWCGGLTTTTITAAAVAVG